MSKVEEYEFSILPRKQWLALQNYKHLTYSTTAMSFSFLCLALYVSPIFLLFALGASIWTASWAPAVEENKERYIMTPDQFMDAFVRAHIDLRASSCVDYVSCNTDIWTDPVPGGKEINRNTLISNTNSYS